MKRRIMFGIVLGIMLGSRVFAEGYDVNRLKAIATVWGEVYIFHPAIVQAGSQIQWEQKLVEFLPEIKKVNTTEEFVTQLNNGLLSCLGDNFTLVRGTGGTALPSYDLKADKKFDYIRISPADLENMKRLSVFDSLIPDRNSDIPLVIDLRIADKISVDYHVYNFFDYFASMFINEPLILSPSVSREHFGWDEYNDWWFYEQRWKVAYKDIDKVSSGKLLPYSDYVQDLKRKNKNIKTEDFVPVTRPVFFITNNTFDAYYGCLLSDMRQNRKNTYIIKENTGKIVVPVNSGLKKYRLPEFDFILNPELYISNNKSGLIYDMTCQRVTEEQLISFVSSDKQKLTDKRPAFSFHISPAKYSSQGATLTLEEKIMGVIKVHTIIGYFHIRRDELAGYWQQALGEYLELAQKTNSDKEYFEMLKKMLCPLDDSHISVGHESLLDFSALFVTPIMFDWVEDGAVVTAFAPELDGTVNLGDEIIAIDDVTIAEVIEKSRKNSPHSNEQSLLSTVVTPGYFIGPSGASVKYEIKREGQSHILDLKRNTHVFRLLGLGMKPGEAVQVWDNNIGYLNMAYFTDEGELKEGMEQIKNTDGLIVDFRNSYPTASFYEFLQMFCKKKTSIRMDEVPVVSASSRATVQTTVSWCLPGEGEVYSKPVLVLVDKSMISRPEDIAIALKSFDNVKFVGEQTQGTDGEMTKIYLPGNGTVSFTGQLVKFGDGADFQSIGIMPDVAVKRTVEGVKNGEDEILNKAVDMFRK